MFIVGCLQVSLLWLSRKVIVLYALEWTEVTWKHELCFNDTQV